MLSFGTSSLHNLFWHVSRLPFGYDQVGSVLLSCAFFYDIFWVFISKRWFHESVMIAVRIMGGLLPYLVASYLVLLVIQAFLS
jgi:hypothetical protein